MGTPEFGALILEDISKTKYRPNLVITASDKSQGRTSKKSESIVGEIAQSLNIETFKSDDINEIEKKILKEKPDLIILAAFGKILTKKIINAPKFGALNVHPSLLPLYRGASPIQSAILNGDKKTGVTIMLMNEKIDEGKIIIQEEVSINKDDDYEALSSTLAKKGAELLIKIIPKWIDGKIEPISQKGESNYVKPIKKEDGRINWEKSAEEITRQLRAFNPWPGLYCFHNFKTEKKRLIKVLEAGVQEQTEVGPFGKPGKVFLASNGNIAVQTGKHFLIIKKLQMEGKKPTKTEDFLNGNIDFIGTILE